MPRAPTRSEASIQKAVVDYARKRGVICIKQHSPGFGSAGWPDYLMIANRGLGSVPRVWFIEFKREGQHLTPLQQRRAEELDGRVKVYMVDNVPLGKQVVDWSLAL